MLYKVGFGLDYVCLMSKANVYRRVFRVQNNVKQTLAPDVWKTFMYTFGQRLVDVLMLAGDSFGGTD